MGFPKAKLAREGTPLLRTMLENLCAAGFGTVTVVTPDEALAEWVGSVAEFYRVIVNPRPADGMISSIRLALAGTAPAAGAMLFWPIDHPLVKVETLAKLRENASEEAVVLPLFRSNRGHPTLWGRGTFAALLSGKADYGANRLIREGVVPIIEIAAGDEGVVVNIDDPATACQFGMCEARTAHRGS